MTAADRDVLLRRDILCATPDCTARAAVRGYCARCHGRLIASGELPRIKRPYVHKLMPLQERLVRNVDKHSSQGGCWLWTSNINRDGYAVTRVMTDGKPVAKTVHRLMYEEVVGPIPGGLVLDHLCRVRHCCNPAHLEPVSGRENVMRGEGVGAVRARWTHCPRGHEYTPENTSLTGGQRTCLICRRASRRRYAEKRKAATQ